MSSAFPATNVILLPTELGSPEKAKLFPWSDEVFIEFIKPVVPLCTVQPLAFANPLKLKDSNV
jgi:hypothetical protein